MYFKVKTLKPGAGIAEMQIDAADRADAARRAASRGCAVLSVTRARGGTGPRRGFFPLLLFSQELLALLESGISLIEAIETLAGKEPRAIVRAVLDRLAARLTEGRSLSDALDEHPAAFPPLYVAAIRASERTGNLGEALARYIAYQSQLESVRAKLVSAAIYPALLLGVGGLVILFLMGYVVPRFSHIYEDVGTQLPWMSRLLLAAGDALGRHSLGLLAILAGAGAVLAGVWPRVRGGLVGALGRVPGLGERLRVLQLARFYRTLGMLQRGGTPIVPALEMVAGLLDPALRTRLQAAIRRIREGQALSSAMEAQGLTTVVAARMLRVGERSGDMSGMMERIALFHDEESARWAEHVTRLFGPLLMLLIGVAIGFVVVLLYLPIFQLADSLQ